MKASTLVWAALILAIGVSMFLLKYKVQALEEELVAKREHVMRDQDALRVLEAEWAYFNDPDRLRRLSAQHLGFTLPSPDQIKSVSALPYRKGFEPKTRSPRDDEAQRLRSVSNTTQSKDTVHANQASHNEHFSNEPVFFARIQRYLMPARSEVSSSFEGTE